ncbi:MAG TPA: VOC family protein, partial [Thermoleophilaceae bacterium]
AFATHGLVALSIPDLVRPAEADSATAAFEVCFVTDDVAGAFARALAAGATEASAPQVKPWGQEVAYVRDLDGNVVELASPVG